ncbi:MAG: sigma-54 dependent transcriptional regulator [Cyclobacteriaceae bacterium]
MQQILVVDDDPSFNDLVSNYLRRQNFTISSVSSAKSALKELEGNKFDLVLADYKLPGMDGLELIGQIKSTYADLPVILITNYADIRVAVDSIKLGAFEFVTKPVIPDELLRVIDLALSKPKGHKTGKDRAERSDYVIGENARTSQLWKHLTMVAPTKMNVLIIGESGTGKEHISRTIHKMSHRSNCPFVAVDCGALSVELAGSELFGHVKGAFTGANVEKKGLFEEANGGTLFLDEAGNLPHEIQSLLLRAIQEGKIKKVGGNVEIGVDVRLLAATNENLDQNVADGSFRNDLYHRLNEFELKVPSLRDRFDDLEEYCEFFVQQASEELGKPPMKLSSEVLDVFKGYHWPGNLRELRNIIRRSVLLSSETVITADTLPAGLRAEQSPVQSISDSKGPEPERLNIKEQSTIQEKQLIVDALVKYKYNKTKAAHALNIDRSTLYYKIKQYQIDS